MTYTKQTRPRAIRSMLTHLTLLIVLLGLPMTPISQHPALAQAAPSCMGALDSLMAEWQSIGFVEPGKPAQTIVAGRHGYSTTGGQFKFMVQQIRDAARNCEAGRDADALASIEIVHDLLHHASHI